MKLFDTVVLLEPVKEKRLQRGQVGTIVEELDVGVFEVEFVDLEGRTLALYAIEENKLLLIHHNLMVA